LLSVQRGYETHVFDRVTDGPKPKLVTDLGAVYHAEALPASGLAPDIIVECTGVASVVLATLGQLARDGIVCLLGVSDIGTMTPVDLGAVNRTAVLENNVIFGSVNANRRHYDLGVAALSAADPAWLGRLISRRVPLASFADAFARQPEDVKVVLQIAGDTVG
jgi:threonine dehydrogenase-like Zn-dependent dehydrogenase